VLRQNSVRPYRAESYRLLGRIFEARARAAGESGRLDIVGNFLNVARRAYGEAANRDLRDAFSRQRLMDLRSAQ
jgi:hypothetical protein